MPSSMYHLTKTHDVAVLNRSSPVLPMHLLTIYNVPLAGPTVPLTLILININTFASKLCMGLTGACQHQHHPHPLTRVLSSPSPPWCLPPCHSPPQ